jgi:hypothetical protein
MFGIVATKDKNISNKKEALNCLIVFYPRINFLTIVYE